MAISYNRMWKLLVDKKMSKADLRKAADIAPNTMTKLRRDEPVNLAILGRICDVLSCDYGDLKLTPITVFRPSIVSSFPLSLMNGTFISSPPRGRHRLWRRYSIFQ